MTTHSVSEDDLQAFVDGELPKGRCGAVLAHLGEHPDEVKRLAEYVIQKDALGRGLDALDLATDDPATAELELRLAERLSGPDSRALLRQAAMVTLLLTAGWTGNSLYQTYLAPSLPSVVIEAAQAHEVFGEDTERPVELMGAARAEIAVSFSQHLGEPVEVPSLIAIGLRLVGGRLLPGEGEPIAQLIYEDAQGRRLTLCLSPEPADLGEQIELVEIDGFTAGYWQEGEIAYALVAETSDQQLVAIAAELGAEQPDDFL